MWSFWAPVPGSALGNAPVPACQLLGLGQVWISDELNELQYIQYGICFLGLEMFGY